MCLKHAEISKINCTLKKNLGKKERKKTFHKMPKGAEKIYLKKLFCSFWQFNEDFIYSIIKYRVFVFYA